jgi:iron complex outermembrane receptor protein
VLGLFAQDEVRLGERLLLNGGLRYDRVSPGASRLSPRAGLIVRATEQTTFKALYGQAFRAPNAYELYYGDSGETQKGNPDLRPETLTSYEGVVEQEIGDTLRAVLSAYHYRIHDLITLTVDETDGLLVFRNLDRAEASGAEAELQYKVPGGLEARASYAFCNARDARTGTRLVNSPRHLSGGRLLLPLAAKRLYAAAELRYLGQRLDRNGGPVDGALLAGLTLTASLFDGRGEIAAGVRNLFDTEYADPTGSEHVQTEIPQDGRTFQVRLTWRF